MEKLKFRVWDKEANQMLSEFNDGIMIQMTTGRAGHYNDEGNFIECYEPPMQYIGVTVKDNKEPCVNDICKVFIETGGISERKSGYMYGIVKKVKSKFTIVPFKYEGEIIRVFGDDTIYGWLDNDFTNPENIEIIGNIYETPNLVSGRHEA